MCRRTIWFRGLLSSGWPQERREKVEGNVNEEMFENYFEQLIEYYEMDLDQGYPPWIASRIFMHELKNIQTTMKVMSSMGYYEEDIEDYIENCDWFSERQKTVWFHDPIDKWFTQYPDRSALGMLAF